MQIQRNMWKLLILFESTFRVSTRVILLFSGLMLISGASLARETYVQFATRLLAQPPDGAAVSPDLESLVLQATNSYRRSKGLPALKPANAKLQQAAEAHAMDLLAQGGMGHTASTGHGFESRIRAFHEGQMVFAAMAENAARVRKEGLSDAQRAQNLVQQWIKSSGHHKNMANRSFVAVAIGVAVKGEHAYAVQIFTGPTVKTNMFGNTGSP